MLSLQNNIIHPDTHSPMVCQTTEYVLFKDDTRLPVVNNIPVLFGSESIFKVEDIISAKITTQDKSQFDNSNIKNYIRRKLLPSLCNDFNIENRYQRLAALLPPGSKILILGAGEKTIYYKNAFFQCQVITSDVHNEFKPDYIFDGHYIPFTDDLFDMVLAAQVIEHTINPWKFCQELQRITKPGGLLQIEAPQNYPYHAEPYDFFRFTFTGIRSLFPCCEVVQSEITEGNASMVAVSISNYLINTSSVKFIRSAWLFVTRILLGWLKYLDKLQPTLNRRTISMPKGYAFTFKKDNLDRKPVQLLDEYYKLMR